jgi:translation initiation factor 1 (eIF-1/SUI1)
MSFIERYDPEKDLDEKIESRVDIYNKQTNGRKSITVVVGLVLSKEDEKMFLSKAREKLNTAGFRKMMPEYNNSKDSYCFQGNVCDELKPIIHELFNIPKSDIILHKIK